MENQNIQRDIGERVLYFGPRDVVLSGIITEITENSYVIEDDTTKIKHRVDHNHLLSVKY